MGVLTDWFDEQIRELRVRVWHDCSSNPVGEDERRLAELERLRDEAARVEQFARVCHMYVPLHVAGELEGDLLETYERIRRELSGAEEDSDG